MQTSEKMAVRLRDGSSMSCYLAKPDKEPAPAVIIIQEIFGITKWLKSTADAYASMGYFAVVPDLFCRLEPEVVLNDRDPAELEKAFKLYQQFSPDQGVKDLEDVAAHLRDHRSINGKVGCTGYCLGGKMAFLMACRTNVDCSVSYYGGGIQEHLAELEKLKNPLLLHIPAEDQYFSPQAQAQIKEAADEHPLVTIHIYPKVNHAFCRVGGENYNKDAADLANARTEEFLKDHLQ